MFPDELIFHIICFLKPRDVIGLRSVSKQFNNVARDIRLWRVLYCSSCLPRPAGPFSWQSIQFLEHNLILSERVSRTWTSRHLKVTSRGEGSRIQPLALPLCRSKSGLLFGRYYVWAQGTEILAQDHITKTSQVLWSNSRRIAAIDVSHEIFPDGQRVYVFLPGDKKIRWPVKLLEFSPKDDTSPSLGPVTFEIEFSLPRGFCYSVCANPPWIYVNILQEIVGIGNGSLMINTQTRAIYKFPAFSSTLRESHSPSESQYMLAQILPMGSYTVTLHTSWTIWGCKVLFQAFIAPTPPQPFDADILELRLTHEAILGNEDAPGGAIVAQLRLPTVCPATGNTHIRSLGIYCRDDPDDPSTDYVSVDITIPPPSPNTTEILPMTVTTNRLFSVRGDIGENFFAVSEDGYGRGGFAISRYPNSEDEGHGTSEPSQFFCKFSLDASGEECTVFVGQQTKENILFEDLKVNIFTGKAFSGVGMHENLHLVMLDIC